MSWGVTLSGLGAAMDALDSLRFEIDDGVIYVAGPTVNYAVYQDQGTSSIEARPFVRPAAERVERNLGTKVSQLAQAQNLALADEDDIVRAAALAVQNEMKQIADRKDIRDTGQLINSISIEQVK